MSESKSKPEIESNDSGNGNGTSSSNTNGASNGHRVIAIANIGQTKIIALIA